MKPRLAILHAPSDGPVSAVVKALAAAFDKRTFKISTHPAASSDISAINAADVVVLVDTPRAGGKVHPEYTEYVRAFKGINLAGRVIGLVLVGGGATKSGFKSALKDAAVRIHDKDLLVESGPPPATKLSAWAGGLTADYRQLVQARDSILPPIN